VTVNHNKHYKNPETGAQTNTVEGILKAAMPYLILTRNY
jgi:hypothetical protein